MLDAPRIIDRRRRPAWRRRFWRAYEAGVITLDELTTLLNRYGL